MPDQLLTVAQAAARLKLCTAHVRALCQQGQLRATKHGRAWLIRAKDLESLRRNPPGPRPKAKAPI